MAKVQKVYTREFQEEAVRLAQMSGQPIMQRDRESGISASSIHQWRKELAQHGPEAFPGSGHQPELPAENRRRKPELERVHQERDILKNVARRCFLRDSSIRKDAIRSLNSLAHRMARAFFLVEYLPDHISVMTIRSVFLDFLRKNDVCNAPFIRSRHERGTGMTQKNSKNCQYNRIIPKVPDKFFCPDTVLQIDERKQVE